jgi:hypothetical protein
MTGSATSSSTERKVGAVFGSPLDVVFSHFDVVEPDVLFVSDAKRKIFTLRIFKARQILSSKSVRRALGGETS